MQITSQRKLDVYSAILQIIEKFFFIIYYDTMIINVFYLIILFVQTNKNAHIKNTNFKYSNKKIKVTIFVGILKKPFQQTIKNCYIIKTKI